MAAVDDAALNARILALADGIGRGDHRIRAAMENLIGSQNDLLTQYIAQLDDTRDWNTKSGKEAKDQLIRLKQISLQRENIDSKYNQTFKAASDKLALLTKKREVAEAEANKQYKKGTAQHRAIMAEHDAAIQKELDALQLESSTRLASLAVIRGADKERAGIEKAQLSKTAEWGSSLQESIKGHLGKLFSKQSLVDAMTEGYRTVVEMAATQTSISAKAIFEGAALGMKPSELIKLQSEYGRTEASMVGGQTAFVDSMMKGRMAYMDMVVDSKEAAKLVASQMQILTNSGIRPARESAALFASTVHQVSRMTHKSAEDITSDLASIQDDDSTQTLLKMASSEQERVAIVQSTNAIYANNVAMGMSTRQAVAAATQLNKLQTQTAKSRITEAARIRVLGASLGMGAQASELARIRTKGPAASEEEKKRAIEISAALSEKITQMRGGSNLASQLNVESLSEGLKLDQQFGPESPFNNTLGNAVKPLTENTGKMVSYLEKIASWGNMLTGGILKNPLLTGAAGLTGYLARGVPGKLFGKGGLSSLGKSAEGIATNATGLAEGATGIGERLLIGGKAVLGRAGGGIGAMLGGAALDMASNYEEKQGNVKTAGALGVGSYAATGAGMGALLGPMGALAGGALGAGYGLYKNWGKLSGTPGTEGAAGTPPSSDERAANDATVKTNESITEQLKKMDTANDFLKNISENSSSSAEYMEKLLYVATMSDKDKQAAATRMNLLKDNRFGSQYGYTM